MKKLMFKLVLLLLPAFAIGQQPEVISMEFKASSALPLDGIVERKVRTEKRVLTYPHLRENDILWEKRVWRLIDTREKMNLSFRYPKEYFFEILVKGIQEGTIQAYSPENDAFQYPLEEEEALKDLVEIDTLPIWDLDFGREEMQVVENRLDPDQITRYRIKEVWYFDKTHGTLNVRILGIAPIISEYDDFGNFKYERPMFWVYYPDCRDWLAKHTYFQEGTDNQVMSWDDLFEMRRFASYITKESNIHDLRLQDSLSGIDRLLESDRIKQDIFNYEHDLWSN